MSTFFTASQPYGTILNDIFIVTIRNLVIDLPMIEEGAWDGSSLFMLSKEFGRTIQALGADTTSLSGLAQQGPNTLIDLSIAEAHLTGNAVFEATHSITASPNVTVANGADVTFHVTDTNGCIILQQGFTAEAGSSFRAYIAAGFNSSTPVAAARNDGQEAVRQTETNTETSETVLAKQKGALPTAFKLSQNYPNPFNPTTTIRYALPKDTHIVLKVYNVLGQEVATLVEGFQRAGHQAAVWDGQTLTGAAVPSGTYLYRIIAGDFVQTKTMVLLK